MATKTVSSWSNRWSNSSGAQVTKSVTSWSGTPNGQQCGLHDNDDNDNDDNGLRNGPSAVQDAFETTCPVSRNIAFAY